MDNGTIHYIFPLYRKGIVLMCWRPWSSMVSAPTSQAGRRTTSCIPATMTCMEKSPGRYREIKQYRKRAQAQVVLEEKMKTGAKKKPMLMAAIKEEQQQAQLREAYGITEKVKVVEKNPGPRRCSAY
ncbi:hypothetical protein NIA69_22810 [Gemmiger formicilis]|nr:hypothetical protein [Gemmiger formicilis]